MSAGCDWRAEAPTPLDWRELIASARRRIVGQQPASRVANHRAVSTAYYAAYDALCQSNAMVLAPNVTDRASGGWFRNADLTVRRRP